MKILYKLKRENMLKSNIAIVTSIIDTPNKPLSYSKVRSVFTKEQRFEQTKKTLESIKKYIPDCFVMTLECSDLTKEEQNYFISNSDVFVNLKGTKHDKYITQSSSKALGEATMTIEALKSIPYDSYKRIFKISGRYWLTDKFNYNNYIEKGIIVKDLGANGVYTCAYKIDKENVRELLNFLENNLEPKLGYEVNFGKFCRGKIAKTVQKFGTEGYVSVDGKHHIG